MIETDVLIIGSGPAGSTAALALSTLGISNVVVTKYRWLANTPRAHITNQRTMEIFRDLGIEAEVMQKSSPQELMGNSVFCTSLAGEELGRLKSWGTHPNRLADYTLSSPSAICDCPQTLLEPILLGTAASRGSRVRFDTEYISLRQDEEGVTATVRDRLEGREYQIRARYLLGCDGGRSLIADQIELPMEGKMAIAGSMNILFEADLSRYVAHRPSVLYWVLQPGANIGGIGMGLIRMVRPWNEWLIVWGYDVNQPPPDVDHEAAIEIVRSLVGDSALDVKVKSASMWTVNHLYATCYSEGRVFCLGDAVHRHPPSNGLGSNTSIQDAYNLAWKLALVIRDQAKPSLLDTYTVERAPIGKQIVKRANKSIEEYKPIFESLGLLDSCDPETMLASMEARKANTEESRVRRESLRRAIAAKTYEFNCHGVEMNQRYDSSAVVGDGTPPPAVDRDLELYYQPTTRPGARLPHVWLFRNGEQVSSLDLVKTGHFGLITGIGGEAWEVAAQRAAEIFGIDLDVSVIGPGCALEDLFGDWSAIREIDEDGCLLIRPDRHIAWRCHHVVDAGSSVQLLSEALGSVLGVDKPHAISTI